MRMTTNAQVSNAYAVQPPPYARAVNATVGRARLDDVARVKFVNWLQIAEPEVFGLLRAAKPELINPGYAVSGLGEETSTTSADLKQIALDTLDFMKQAVPAYFQYQGQSKLIEINLQRLARGEPPLSAESVAPGVNVGLSPETRKLVYIGVAGVLVLGLYYVSKRR